MTPLDLRSRLEMYNRDSAKVSSVRRNEARDIHELLEGCVAGNDDGSCFLVENRYPLSYVHGGYALGKCLEIDMRNLGRVFPCIAGDESIRDFVFLDTETTGLSGGTGTVAFLVGAGYFESDVFVLRQYMMRDYNEEPAMLREIAALLAQKTGLVTFNGKAFDWNILTTRFIFNRIPPGLEEPVQADLLYPCRKLWKLKLGSCRLVCLEENILGEYRVNDIPGALIPQVYFRYLEDRDAADMKRVIDHNRRDILSMISLLTKIDAMLKDPLGQSDCEEELFNLGRIFFKNGEYDNVIRCLENCTLWGNIQLKDKASVFLSTVYKRQGEYKRAVTHWSRMVSQQREMRLFEMIELAKHYEHREKDLQYALNLVEKAVDAVVKTGNLRNRQYEDLKKRKERLKMKAREERKCMMKKKNT